MLPKVTEAASVDDPLHGPGLPAADPAVDRATASESGARGKSHSEATVLSLRQAMRRARFDEAERSGAVADLREARLGRLEVLREALQPLLAQIPADVDCFDIGIMPGANPRLFIDMIGFVEMGRDPRVYQFIQDTRHGRIRLAESETLGVIVEAATHYVARRLLERDKALATDTDSARHIKRYRAAEPQAASPPRARRSAGRVAGAVFAFFIDVLGSIAFFSLLAFAAWAWWSSLKQ